MDTQAFYDELADDYDALHIDWRASVHTQGEVLDRLIRSELGDAPQRVLDCACGIGTQAIGIALHGHDVLATDLSPGAVRRAAAEATAMGARLATGVADFTRLGDEVDGTFACVLACDNSVAHLHRCSCVLKQQYARRLRLYIVWNNLVSFSGKFRCEPSYCERCPGNVDPGTSEAYCRPRPSHGSRSFVN